MLKKIISGIVLVVILLGAGLTYTLFASSTVSAQLHVESGTVTVNGKTVTSDQQLSRNDVIETTNGKATVILHESIIISLEPATEVTLDDITQKNPVIKQTGTTWNTFMKIAGVDGFDIKTSTSIASVRGTSFQLTDTKILTADGTVNYKQDDQTFTVTEMNVVEKQAKGMVERKANTDEIKTVKQHYQHAINEIKHLRKLEMKKHAILMNMIKTQYDMNDTQLNEKLDEIDNGAMNVDDLMKQTPFAPASLEKIAVMTKEIQKMRQKLAST